MSHSIFWHLRSFSSCQAKNNFNKKIFIRSFSARLRFHFNEVSSGKDRTITPFILISISQKSETQSPLPVLFLNS